MLASGRYAFCILHRMGRPLALRSQAFSFHIRMLEVHQCGGLSHGTDTVEVKRTTVIICHFAHSCSQASSD